MACKGVTEPPVGVADIGIADLLIIFVWLYLAGVKKDPGEFNCDIEKDGKVLIRGVTSTGGRTASRYSWVFDMKVQQHVNLELSLTPLVCLGPLIQGCFHQISDLRAFLKLLW